MNKTEEKLAEEIQFKGVMTPAEVAAAAILKITDVKDLDPLVELIELHRKEL